MTHLPPEIALLFIILIFLLCFLVTYGLAYTGSLIARSRTSDSKFLIAWVIIAAISTVVFYFAGVTLVQMIQAL